MREEDVPAEQPETQQEARFPHPDAQARGSSGDRAPAAQGPHEPVGLIWRVRDRATFRALAEGRRHRRGVLTMTRVATEPGAPARVAFAIGRPVGSAVVRNKLRRRLRAACREHATEFVTGHSYLVGATPKAASASYDDLDTMLQALLESTASRP
jgi:ribonuclease P protein component